MQDIIEKAKIQFENQLPFVLFANPNTNKLKAYFQNDDVLNTFEGQDGFVFTSFDKEKKYVLEASKCAILFDKITNSMDQSVQFEVVNSNEIERKGFEALVESALNAIENNQFKKVVVSRKVTLSIEVDYLRSFLLLLSTYKTAFRYLFFHPKIGMWMGASPEQLLYITNDAFETVALAGTQLYTDNINWKTKEKEEQQLVTDYIINQITPYVKEMDVSNPFTVKAGNLAHIKTTIKAKLVDSNIVFEIANALHPTSAICGLPKETSLGFILAKEGYDRKFYSGYIGEWKAVEKSLFVNLRCMEIENRKAHLYVGCGITKDSIPENEFFETQNKMGTMLKVIKVKSKK